VTEAEKKAHALRLAKEWLQDYEFLNVVEDWDLVDENASEEDLLAIHAMVQNVKVSID
jgi:hypothetical protein